MREKGYILSEDNLSRHQTGLYTPANEHDACGVGMIVNLMELVLWFRYHMSSFFFKVSLFLKKENMVPDSCLCLKTKIFNKLS